MVTLTSISTMRGRPIEDGSFYPKIKQKFNNTSPDFINYNPHSSSTSSPQRSPTLKFRGNSSSHNITTSFSTGSVDLESLNSPAECNPLDQESRNEKVFYPPSSNSASLVAVNPFLISSIVLPKVNGDMVPGKASPQRYIARKGRSLPTLLPGIVGGSSFEVVIYFKACDGILSSYLYRHSL